MDLSPTPVASIQAMSQIDWSSVNVRSMQASDIPLIVDYLYAKTAPHPYPYLNIARMKPEAETFARYKSRLYNPGNIPTLIVEFMGKPIGMHSLQPIWRAHGDFQAHLWDAEARGKGMGPIAWYKSNKILFRRFGLERIFFRAPKGNPSAQAFVRKLPLTLIGEERIQDPMLVAGLHADVFEITREQFNQL